MVSPVLVFLRFYRTHGYGVLRHIVDQLNRGCSIEEISDSSQIPPYKIRRVVNALTERKFVFREELLQFLAEENERRQTALGELKADRAKVLRLASFNDSHEEPDR